MALALDGNAAGTSGASLTTTATLTTGGAGDIIVICFTIENISSGATPVISTITVGGSNATLRNTVAYTSPAGVGGSKNLIGIYWFYASAKLTSSAVTVTTTLANDNGAVVVFAIKGFTGAAYQTNPWDSSAATALGWAVTNTTASQTQLASAANITTANASDLLFAVGGTGDNTASLPFGTKLGTSTAAGIIGAAAAQVNTGAFAVTGTDQATCGAEYLVVSSIQTSITANFASAATAEGWVIMPDAIYDGTPAAPAQTLHPQIWM